MDSKTATFAGIGLALGAVLVSVYMYQYATHSSSAKSGKAKKNETKAKAKENSSKGHSAVVDDDVINEDTECLKGYKTTSDGRKTSYFNRELSEQDKKLIGDCKPKKISGSDSAISASNSPRQLSPSPASGSISVAASPTRIDAAQAPVQQASGWNTAGTWEERTSTAWAHQELTALLQNLHSVTCIPLEGTVYTLTLTVPAVTSIDGEVYVAFTRGKKLYLYDLKVKLNYELTIECASVNGGGGMLDASMISGTLNVSDISPDDDNFEYEVTQGIASAVTKSSKSGKSVSGFGCKPEHVKKLLQLFLRGKTQQTLKHVVEAKKAGSFVDNGGSDSAGPSNLTQAFVNCFADFLCHFHAQ